MKKIFVALSMLAFLAGCDDSSSASAENSEPAALSSAEKYGSSSSSRHCEECNDEAISSDSNAESNGSSQSSSSEKNAESSSSEKLSGAGSSSAGKAKSSSSENSSSSAMETITSSDGSVYDSSSNTLTDLRDGQTYKTVTIGTQTWMADNLNYETENSYCYDDDPSNCSKYGRLYTWAAAKTVCPSGWHLPSKTEFEALITAVGGSSTAGAKLKSQTGWTAYDGITNEDAFGFSALPAGSRYSNGVYYYEGSHAYFWRSTEYDSRYAYFMYLNYSLDGAYLSHGKDLGFSVRCVKD